MTGPSKHVELAHRYPQACHAFALLSRRHGRCAVQGVGGFLNVIWIDDQSLRHFARCARKAAEHQHALFIVARRHELFTNQIHAVVQACDHANVGGTKQFGHRFAVVVLCQQMHRLIVLAAKAFVDVLRNALDTLLEQSVLLQRATGGRSHLQKNKATDPFRMGLQQMLYRMQSLQNSLGVVEPIHSHGQAGVLMQMETLEHLTTAFNDGRHSGHVGVGRPLDRYRIARHQGFLLAKRDCG